MQVKPHKEKIPKLELKLKQYKIFSGFDESEIVCKTIDNGLNKLYYQYVDDTLVLAKPEHKIIFNTILSTQQFFYNNLSYMIHKLEDISLDRTTKDICRKNTNTDQYVLHQL